MKNLLALFAVVMTACSPTTIVGGPGDDIGAPGPTGSPGRDGYNSVVMLSPDAPSCAQGGVTIISALDTNRSGEVELGEDQQIRMATVCNGAAAQGAFASVEIMDPCGDHPTKFDEVLLRLGDGKVLVTFSDTVGGDNTRLALLQGPGSYQTTDGTNCAFSLDANGRLL